MRLLVRSIGRFGRRNSGGAYQGLLLGRAYLNCCNNKQKANRRTRACLPFAAKSESDLFIVPLGIVSVGRCWGRHI